MTNKEALHVVAKTSINPDEIANAQNKVKEETTMKNSKALTFEINGTTTSTRPLMVRRSGSKRQSS